MGRVGPQRKEGLHDHLGHELALVGIGEATDESEQCRLFHEGEADEAPRPGRCSSRRRTSRSSTRPSRPRSSGAVAGPRSRRPVRVGVGHPVEALGAPASPRRSRSAGPPLQTRCSPCRPRSPTGRGLPRGGRTPRSGRSPPPRTRSMETARRTPGPVQFRRRSDSPPRPRLVLVLRRPGGGRRHQPLVMMAVGLGTQHHRSLQGPGRCGEGDEVEGEQPVQSGPHVGDSIMAEELLVHEGATGPRVGVEMDGIELTEVEKVPAPEQPQVERRVRSRMNLASSISNAPSWYPTYTSARAYGLRGPTTANSTSASSKSTSLATRVGFSPMSDQMARKSPMAETCWVQALGLPPIPPRGRASSWRHPEEPADMYGACECLSRCVLPSRALAGWRARGRTCRRHVSERGTAGITGLDELHA